MLLLSPVVLQSYQAVAQDICESLLCLGLDAVTMPDGADLVQRLADQRIELVGGWARGGRRARGGWDETHNAFSMPCGGP